MAMDSLGQDEVHIWQVDLGMPPACLTRLLTMLSEDERERAQRFRFRQDRDRFVAAHGRLRDILSRYVGQQPAAIRFRSGPYGKPALAPPQSTGEVRFNLSHSGGVALLALARGREVGVDVEQIRPDLAGEGVAERFFAPGEVAALRALSEERRVQGFFVCWTRKEAYLKATGRGLSIPLNQFEVTLDPDGPAALRRTEWDPDDASRWSLASIPTMPGYAAALAVEGCGWRWVPRQWPMEQVVSP